MTLHTTIACPGDLTLLVTLDKEERKAAKKAGVQVPKSGELENLTSNRAWGLYNLMYYRGITVMQARTLVVECEVRAAACYCPLACSPTAAAISHICAAHRTRHHASAPHSHAHTFQRCKS